MVNNDDGVLNENARKVSSKMFFYTLHILMELLEMIKTSLVWLITLSFFLYFPFNSSTHHIYVSWAINGLCITSTPSCGQINTTDNNTYKKLFVTWFSCNNSKFIILCRFVSTNGTNRFAAYYLFTNRIQYILP